MPVEITSLEKFAEIVKRAEECRIKRSKGAVKIKARTARYLYTYKTTEQALQEVLSKISCKQIVEIDKAKGK